MKIQDLPVPAGLKQIYRNSGITDLYPPQAECVEKGMFQGEKSPRSHPYCQWKNSHCRDSDAPPYFQRWKGTLYRTVKALASEKSGEFSGKGVRVGISTGDFDRKDDYLGKNDIIVATSEKVDSLLRNNTRWLNDITLLVIDEGI